MKVRRTICIGCLLATLLAVAADSASASTLLSGYGGPGQGNQASLGSALLNGPKGGGRSGRGGSGAGSASNSSAPAGVGGGGGSESGATGTGTGEGSVGGSGTAATGGAHSTGASGQGVHGARGGDGQRNDKGARGSNAQTGQGPSNRPRAASSLYPASERIPAGESSDALGVSGSDLLYIVLAFVALAIVAALMRGLARPESVGRSS